MDLGDGMRNKARCRAGISEGNSFSVNSGKSDGKGIVRFGIDRILEVDDTHGHPCNPSGSGDRTCL